MTLVGVENDNVTNGLASHFGDQTNSTNGQTNSNVGQESTQCQCPGDQSSSGDEKHANLGNLRDDRCKECLHQKPPDNRLTAR